MTQDENAVYLAADELKNAGQFCAAICRARTREFFDRQFIPQADELTATVTFIEFENRTYAVTAHHVIESFRRMAESELIVCEGYFVPVAPGIYIDPPFIKPPAVFPYAEPDISLRQIDRDRLPPGKKCIKIERKSPDCPPPFVLAAGFPTAAKEAKPSLEGERIAFRCFDVIVEGLGTTLIGDQVSFYSEVPKEKIGADVSGLSGGPVFWSEGDNFGLIGFVKEAMIGSDLDNGKFMLSLVCQRVDYDIFSLWSSYVDNNFEREREYLNRIIAKNGNKKPPTGCS